MCHSHTHCSVFTTANQGRVTEQRPHDGDPGLALALLQPNGPALPINPLAPTRQGHDVPSASSMNRWCGLASLGCEDAAGNPRAGSVRDRTGQDPLISYAVNRDQIAFLHACSESTDWGSSTRVVEASMRT